MNLMGYYAPDSVWIPDPIAQQKSRAECSNNFCTDKKKKEKEEDLMTFDNRSMTGHFESSRERTASSNFNKDSRKSTEKHSALATHILINDTHIWSNNGGTGDTILYSANDVVINISSKGKDDKKLFDIFVSLRDSPKDRLLIEISQKQTHAALYDLIRQALETKYEILGGLKGLRVKEMQKELRPGPHRKDMPDGRETHMG